MTTPNIRELRRQRARRQAGGPLLLKILIALAGLYVVYVLVGFLVAPSIIKTQIERRASAQLKREVRVDHVAFNPLALTLRLDKLVVRDHDGQPLLGWSQLFVNFQVFSLFADEIHFSEILLDGFSTRLAVSKDGILNVADIIPPSPSTPSSGKAWTLTIDRLTVNGAEIDYTDASRAEPFTTHIGPTTFVLREFRTSGGPGAPGLFKATTEAGESVEWNGRLALAPLRSNGEVRLTRMMLKKYTPFYPGALNFDVLNGTIDVQAPYEFSIENNKPQVKITEASVQGQGLELAEHGKTEALMGLKTFEVTHASLDLQGNSADVRQINLAGGNLVVRRDASGINLARLAAPRPNGPPARPATAAPSGPALSAKIAEVNGKDFTFSVEDKATPRPAAFQLNHASFSLKHFSLQDLAGTLPVDFRADLAPGAGTVHLEGQVSASPLKADLSFAVEGASVAVFSPWAETFADLRLTQGVAGVRGQVHLAPGPGGAPLIAATSDLDVSLLAVTDAKGEPLLGWKSLVVHGVEYSSSPERLTVAEISVADPTVKVLMNRDHVLNVSTLMRQDASAKPAPTVGLPAQEPAIARFIAIDRVALANASINYLDQSIDPNVSASIDQLSGTVVGLTSAAIDRADVSLNGRIGGTAPLTVAGKINALSNSPAADVKVEIKDTDLKPLAAYVGKFTGYELASGALSLDSKAKVNNRKLDSTTSLIVTNFTLGAPTNSPDALHVPIHLALSLLKDRDGKIVLADLPAQGSLDDPSFQISGVIMHVIGNVITKAATSPFSLIGSIFGGGRSGEDLSFQDFAPGVTELTEANIKKLDVVARALRERPALHVTIAGSADAALDLAPMRERELERRIRTAIWDEAKKVDPSLDTPDKVVVSREAADRVLGLFYRDVFMPAQPEAVAAPTKTPEPAPRRGFFLFRWFTRSKPAPAPTPAPTTTASVPRSPAPRAGKQAPAQPGGPVIAGEYGKVIGAEYGTVIGLDKNPQTGLPGVAEMRQRLLEAIPVGDAELKKLAAERAEKVQNYLIAEAKVPAEQVEMAEQPLAKGTRTSLQLK